MRLASLELVEKAMRCYGIRMLKTFEDADFFSTLLKLYGLYPFNDIALSLVTNILAHAIDFKLADEQQKQMTKVVSRKPKFAFRAFSLDENEDDEEPKKLEDNEDDVDDPSDADQREKDELLVHMLFKTDLLQVVMNACSK